MMRRRKAKKEAEVQKGKPKKCLEQSAQTMVNNRKIKRRILVFFKIGFLKKYYYNCIIILVFIELFCDRKRKV